MLAILFSSVYKQKQKQNKKKTRNFEFLPIFHKESKFSGSAMLCDVITRLYSFWYVWIEEINTYQLIPKQSLQRVRLQLSIIYGGGCNRPPSPYPCYKNNSLVRRRLNIFLHILNILGRKKCQ